MKNEILIESEKILDGRSIPCPVKHGLIIQKWLDLAVGDYFVLVNDHDPVRMREQFSAEWPGAFDWQHLQGGPEGFRVKITKVKPLMEAASAELSCSCGH
ncbi:MAG TPA: DUF2249 domain-containing protein [Verrucomicrobiae bacterium]|nr:DUF2249 domain-containing protein [Verrucomicrobiae bacterium]